jgi:hypothetical protein
LIVSDAQWSRLVSALKLALVFINGFAALIGTYPGPEVPALVRLLCAATAAGCGAALLMLTPPGRSNALADDIAALSPAGRARLQRIVDGLDDQPPRVGL